MLFGLLGLTALLFYICIGRVYLSDELLPAHKSELPWKLKAITDEWKGGSSTASVAEDVYSLDYEYHLTEQVRFPAVTATVAFGGPDHAGELTDLSRYSTATFRVKCSPRNILSFFVYSFDDKVTTPGIMQSYRVASAPFSCDEEWSDVEIDLRHLKVPLWWLEQAKLDFSEQEYWLDKVVAIAFDASRLGPLNTPVRVKIGELTLHGRDWRYAWGFAALAAVIWSGFISWFFRGYTRNLVADLTNKLKKNKPLIAYQRLSIEPHRDKEKNQVLRFMETEYANPEMSLEYAVETLGINRTKINELLKDEFGMTFCAYLNKLRLSEAARLLAQEAGANVADIAYSVGYNNVSYFSKIFKAEYGCTPGAFTGMPGTAVAE